jgi:hypothetical protein
MMQTGRFALKPRIALLLAGKRPGLSSEQNSTTEAQWQSRNALT